MARAQPWLPVLLLGCVAAALLVAVVLQQLAAARAATRHAALPDEPPSADAAPQLRRTVLPLVVKPHKGRMRLVSVDSVATIFELPLTVDARRTVLVDTSEWDGAPLHALSLHGVACEAVRVEPAGAGTTHCSRRAREGGVVAQAPRALPRGAHVAFLGVPPGHAALRVWEYS